METEREATREGEGGDWCERNKRRGYVFNRKKKGYDL